MAQSSTLTRPTYAKLSPHEFLLANLQPTTPDSKPRRTNGRAPDEARAPKINPGSLTHAHGSAIVRSGDTTVLCGVRGEILPVTHIPHYRPRHPTDPLDAEGGSAAGRREIKDYDLLVPNIELATGSAPQFLPGVPPTALAQTLSTRVHALLHSCGLLDAEDLRIWHTPPGAEGNERMEEDGEGVDTYGKQEPEVKAYWTLYIDLLFISFDGNPFDAAWAAMLAALRDTKLPGARWDADREAVVCTREAERTLRIQGWPVACTSVVLMEKDKGEGGKYWILVDPNRGEEDICGEAVTVVVDRSTAKTRIRGISKSGGVVVGPQLMGQLVMRAERRWEEFRQAFLP